MAGRKERERGVSELVSNELGHWCPASPARAAERGFSRSIAFEAAAYQHQLQGWWLEPLVSLQLTLSGQRLCESLAQRREPAGLLFPRLYL